MLHARAAAGEVSGDGERWIHCGKELGLFLDHLREPLLDKAIQDFVDLLPRHMGAGGKFQRFEARMPDQDQIGTGLIRIQADLLNFRQFS